MKAKWVLLMCALILVAVAALIGLDLHHSASPARRAVAMISVPRRELPPVESDTERGPSSGGGDEEAPPQTAPQPNTPTPPSPSSTAPTSDDNSTGNTPVPAIGGTGGGGGSRGVPQPRQTGGGGTGDGRKPDKDCMDHLNCPATHDCGSVMGKSFVTFCSVAKCTMCPVSEGLIVSGYCVYSGFDNGGAAYVLISRIGKKPIWSQCIPPEHPPGPPKPPRMKSPVSYLETDKDGIDF